MRRHSCVRLILPYWKWLKCVIESNCILMVLMENGHDIKDEDAVEIPINGVLDLHTFHPGDVPGVLEDYLTACREAGVHSVRIIHGKGKGIQKNRVRALLERMTMVESYKDAGHGAGGWGATLAELKRDIDFEWAQWARTLESGAKTLGTCLKGSETARLVLHAKELMVWNRTVNLTAITDPTALAVKQYLDVVPLSCLPPPASRLLDIGSGGGFPGIPLKIFRPDLHVTMIDGSRKKVNFLKHIIRTLGLKNAEARQIRAEALKKEVEIEGGRFNVIVSKAVTKLERFLDQAVALLDRRGMLIAMKGPSVEAEIEAAQGPIKAAGLSVTVRTYELPYLKIERCLIILSRPSDSS